MEVANEAGYQRNKGELHHAEALAMRAEEEHLHQSATIIPIDEGFVPWVEVKHI